MPDYNPLHVQVGMDAAEHFRKMIDGMALWEIQAFLANTCEMAGGREICMHKIVKQYPDGTLREEIGMSFQKPLPGLGG